MNTLRGGRPYRVTGASSKTGEEVEITVDAYDEADAARAANRQGVFVSACVAADPDHNPEAAAMPRAAPEVPFSEVVARDAVIQKLLLKHPEIKYRVKRLNAERPRLPLHPGRRADGNLIPRLRPRRPTHGGCTRTGLTTGPALMRVRAWFGDVAPVYGFGQCRPLKSMFKLERNRLTETGTGVTHPGHNPGTHRGR